MVTQAQPLHSELLIYIADSFACRFHDINSGFTAADLYTRGWTPYCSDFGIGYASTVDTHTDIGLLDDLFNKDKKL